MLKKYRQNKALKIIKKKKKNLTPKNHRKTMKNIKIYLIHYLNMKLNQMLQSA